MEKKVEEEQTSTEKPDISDEVTVRRDDPTKAERKMYKRIKGSINEEFTAYFQNESIMENYTRVLTLINRLKQASIHVGLIDLSEDCGICSREVQDAVILPCTHVFCRDCLMQMYPPCVPSAGVCCNCPTCTGSFKRNLVVQASLKGKRKHVKAKGTNNILTTSCTKIEALREEITWMFGTDGSAKAVIFSRYKSFLELINRQLTESGLQCVQLSKSADGKSALKRFKEDGHCKILLTTFEIAGDSLDLSVASHVFLMDPGWNPITDRQALARVQNFRQGKPTRMVKFISKGTIEVKIIDVFEEKQNTSAVKIIDVFEEKQNTSAVKIIDVFEEKQNTLAGVDLYSSSIDKLTEEDIKYLLAD